MSRLGGEAVEHMYARRKPKSHNPYITADEVLDDLKEIYEDPDKENSYRRQYNALKQGPRKFSEFFSEFRRLSSLLEYGENQLIHDLKDKITRRLLKAVVSQWIQPTTVNEYKNYLIRLDNEQRAIRERKNKETAAPTSPALVKLSASSNCTISADRQHQVDTENGNCYTCHRPGHTANKCPSNWPVAAPYFPPFSHNMLVSEIGTPTKISAGSETVALCRIGIDESTNVFSAI